MRSNWQKFKDFITFPARVWFLYDQDRFGLSCWATERFDYVSGCVRGYCLDVGCGPHNRFISEFLNNDGVGIDVYPYNGLDNKNIVSDITQFPFADNVFDTVTFIANINHIPRSLRDIELSEAYRVLKVGGNIIVTMGNPLAELAAHRVLGLADMIWGTKHNVDNERGMSEEESYFLTDNEIKSRIKTAGFSDIRKKYFVTQWCLNHLFIGFKS